VVGAAAAYQTRPTLFCVWFLKIYAVNSGCRVGARLTERQPTLSHTNWRQSFVPPNHQRRHHGLAAGSLDSSRLYPYRLKKKSSSDHVDADAVLSRESARPQQDETLLHYGFPDPVYQRTGKDRATDR
jgi:hypothetical protein